MNLSNYPLILRKGTHRELLGHSLNRPASMQDYHKTSVDSETVRNFQDVFQTEDFTTKKNERLPLTKATERERIIQDMERDAVIEPSKNPWTSLVLVKKKDGMTRFCVDYHLFNNVTKKNIYPLPKIDDTLNTLGGRFSRPLILKAVIGEWNWGPRIKRRLYP
ncbi:hypothetical protein Trydic_g4307 [Trypoxylus dichotomus]